LRKLPWLEVGGVEGDGLPALAAGPHALSVTASNRAGLSATLTATLDVRTVEAGGLDALPGSGYAFQAHEITPAGLVLTMSRKSAEGSTPVTAGGRRVKALRVHASSGGAVQVLLPRDELPREGGAVSVGGATSEWLAAAGPGRLDAGALRLTLPQNAVGVATPSFRDAAFPGCAAHLSVGPYELQTKASVEFPGFAPKPRVGVYGGGLFLDNWTGKPVPFLADGLYCLREDAVPPVWGKPQTVRIPHINEPELWLELTDRGSGPNLYSLRLTMDGKPAFADWDPDTKTVRVDLSGLGPGRHSLACTVADWAGNVAKLPPTAFTAK